MSEKNSKAPHLALVPSERTPEYKKRLIPFERTFQAGDIVFSQGEAGTTLFVVREGEVQITVPHPHPEKGIQVELAVVGKGGIVGDGAVFGNSIRSATALAKSDCHLLEFTREQFVGIFLSGGERAESILRSLLKRTLQTNDRYLDKLVQIVDLEERISGLEADRLDAGWFSEKKSQDSMAAKTALEQARTEIAGLRGELAQRVLLTSGEDDIKAWRKTFTKLQTERDDWEREARRLEKRLRDSEREQQMIAEALDLSEERRMESEQRRIVAVDSADAAVKAALEQIDTLQNENTALLQQNTRLLTELEALHKKENLGELLEGYVLLNRPKR